MRPAGFTFVKILEVTKHACEDNDRLAILLFPHLYPMEHAFHMMADLLYRPLGSFLTVKSKQMSFEFGNNSVVWLRDIDFIMKDQYHHLKMTLIAEDNSIQWANLNVKYHDTVRLLRARIKAANRLRD